MAIEFQAKLPRQVPNSVAVYELQRPRVTTASVAALAKSLGLTGGGKDFITSADSIAYREERVHLEVNRVSGAVAYRHLDNYGRQTEKPFELSDRRAVAVARKVLGQSKLIDLASARMAKVTHLNGAVADAQGKSKSQTVIDAGVVYRRIIDKLAVTGPGGVAMVNVGSDANVIGISCIWRALGKKKATVKIKDPDELLRAFSKEASRWMGDTTVIQADFGYFEQGTLDRQTILEPVYALVYVQRFGEVARKSAYVMAAGEKSFAPLMGKKRFPSRQTRRPGLR